MEDPILLCKQERLTGLFTRASSLQAVLAVAQQGWGALGKAKMSLDSSPSPSPYPLLLPHCRSTVCGLLTGLTDNSSCSS